MSDEEVYLKAVRELVFEMKDISFNKMKELNLSDANAVVFLQEVMVNYVGNCIRQISKKETRCVENNCYKIISSLIDWTTEYIDTLIENDKGKH